jgi:hypothetical protein
MTGGNPRPDPFGQVLPDRTRDEEDRGWGEREYDDDERLRREVPPHHCD